MMEALRKLYWRHMNNIDPLGVLMCYGDQGKREKSSFLLLIGAVLALVVAPITQYIFMLYVCMLLL